MSGYKSFAIVGLGNMGIYIADEFLKAKADGTVKEVVVLTRANSTNPHAEEYAKKGAKIFALDYADKAAVTRALAGVDVLISTLAVWALHFQLPLAEAAKAAGVQIFVPSEFAKDTEGDDLEGPFGNKSSLHAKFRELCLAYTLVFTGPFPDFCFISLLDLDVKSGSVKVGGDGNAPMTLTGRPDIARFLLYAFTKLPPSELKNQTFSIEGDRKSFNEIFKEYEARTGKKVTVEYVPIAELEASVKADTSVQNFAAAFHHHVAIGEGALPEPLANSKFPDWHPKSAIDYILE